MYTMVPSLHNFMFSINITPNTYDNFLVMLWHRVTPTSYSTDLYYNLVYGNV